MKHTVALALLVISPFAQADTIVQWDFNTDDGSTSTGTTSPSTGMGALSLVGGSTSFFGGSFGSSDPAGFPLDSAWSVGGYPSQGTASGTAGFRADASTLGLQGITVSFDYRNQPSSNKFFDFQYTLDGFSWTTAESYGIATVDTWFNQKTVDLSGVSGANNNALFGFRIVAVFEPNTTQYKATDAGYNGDFGVLYDMVTVSGEPVPEPGILAILGLGCAVLRRRR